MGKDGKEIIYCRKCYTTLNSGEVCPKGHSKKHITKKSLSVGAPIIPSSRIAVEHPPVNYGNYAKRGANV